MKLFIQSLNDAQDNRGNRSQGFDVLDERGCVGWLRPSLRLRLECGHLDLNPGDAIAADDFIYVARNGRCSWPEVFVSYDRQLHGGAGRHGGDGRFSDIGLQGFKSK